jgi:SagB-type dehydrogenase family enzyme
LPWPRARGSCCAPGVNKGRIIKMPELKAFFRVSRGPAVCGIRRRNPPLSEKSRHDLTALLRMIHRFALSRRSVRNSRFGVWIGLFCVMRLCGEMICNAEEKAVMSQPVIKLPGPDYTVNCDLNRALHERRSVREYADGGLSQKELGELLWAAQGITSLGGYRTAPSAGALYPLEIWVAVGNVEGIETGLYRYDPRDHALKKSKNADVREALAEASLGQMWMAPAPAMIILTAVPSRTKSRYGDRGMRYVYMEVGHVGQNISLAAVALQLGTVVVAAFEDTRVSKVLDLPSGEVPLYIMPVGRKK